MTPILRIRVAPKGVLCAVFSAVVLGLPASAQTDIDFEAPSYVSGLLQDQDTWTVAKTNEVVLTAGELAENLTLAGLTPGTPVHGGSRPCWSRRRAAVERRFVRSTASPPPNW